MAIQLSSVARYLQSKNINFKEGESHVLAPFELETSAGKTEALLAFSAPVDGKVFSVEAVNFLPKEVVGKLLGNQGFVLALLNLGWRTPFGGVELSSNADEIRFVVEIPLMDSTLTEAQFHAVLDGVQHGAKMVCELALETLGTGTGGDDLMKKLNAAAEILASREASGEDKKRALDFIVAVANDENVPTEVRTAATKLVAMIKQAIAEAEGQSSGGSPFA